MRSLIIASPILLDGIEGGWIDNVCTYSGDVLLVLTVVV